MTEAEEMLLQIEMNSIVWFNQGCICQSEHDTDLFNNTNTHSLRLETLL